MVSILINKDVFEPSCNDLKFSLKPKLLFHQPNNYREAQNHRGQKQL